MHGISMRRIPIVSRVGEKPISPSIRDVPINGCNGLFFYMSMRVGKLRRAASPLFDSLCIRQFNLG